MAELAGKQKESEQDKHLANVRALWDALDGIQDKGGKHDVTKALAAIRATLSLYYAYADVKVIFTLPNF